MPKINQKILDKVGSLDIDSSLKDFILELLNSELNREKQWGYSEVYNKIVNTYFERYISEEL